MKVAVVGAGFSGLLTAVHVLRLSPEARVVLIERSGVFGPGTAYATTNPDHVLNVRLTNMSAFSDEPHHLAEWLTEQSGWSATSQFITRGLYGRYLRSILDGARTCGRLTQLAAEVEDIERVGVRWRLRLSDQRPMLADAVVLALGVMEPTPPVGIASDLLASSAYLANPWGQSGGLSDAAEHVLLVGSGLTMVDVAIGLARPGRRFTALSRRGLTPRGHGLVGPAIWEAPDSLSPVALLRAVRDQAKARDWRMVMDGLRSQASTLWRDWTPVQRRQFLRHLRPWWDVHRHRLAPAVKERLDALIDLGEVSVVAGRTVSLKRDARGIVVTWRRRGERRARQFRVDAVVNCTGPNGAVDHAANPLISSLRRRGLLTPDPSGLGARIDDRCRLVDWRNQPLTGVHAVGPLTRGAFWEITSVPDIREQALGVARAVLDGSALQAGLALRALPPAAQLHSSADGQSRR
ncbi:FAD/NAD(P)-binding protein [Brevundimonas variabilis]|uniref:Putative NAD(P)/FAD-binding protein YdhS n=1 Tax=Brevundimonas variabilis TaxID=74312 RepID=A0A7W9CKH4_9CAUL|nr:FAD/NAD(P)-binding protein [Brevundimonas variabilis]MBB5747277.1 putative NAD(P)/FAD-binding protein YdhS [Brevundimonas variabilis]